MPGVGAEKIIMSRTKSTWPFMAQPMASKSYDVACPACGAAVGEPCHSTGQWPRTLERPHQDRARGYLELLATQPKREGRAEVIEGRTAGRDHAVISLKGGPATYRREPCPTCPWRKDATGEFPAEAFKHSAGTAYDMSTHTFACHQSGKERPALCAGFLLRGADHNLAVRLKRIERGQVSDGGHELHDSYRAMAVANGVNPDDPALGPCRP